MKTKLIVFMLIAGSAAFAQTRFSIRIRGRGPGYSAPPQAYYGPDSPRAYTPRSGGAGYWGENPDRQHRREEWHGLRNHQEGERYMYGDSQELWEHQAQERRELRHEQWHERNGDFDATDGPAHGSARDGMYRYR